MQQRNHFGGAVRGALRAGPESKSQGVIYLGPLYEDRN